MKRRNLLLIVAIIISLFSGNMALAHSNLEWDHIDKLYIDIEKTNVYDREGVDITEIFFRDTMQMYLNGQYEEIDNYIKSNVSSTSVLTKYQKPMQMARLINVEAPIEVSYEQSIYNTYEGLPGRTFRFTFSVNLIAYYDLNTFKFNPRQVYTSFHRVSDNYGSSWQLYTNNVATWGEISTSGYYITSNCSFTFKAKQLIDEYSWLEFNHGQYIFESPQYSSES